MKRIVLMMLAAGVVMSASAQMEGMGLTAPKIDVNKVKASIAKSDAAIGDPKKSGKAATWIERGKVFVDAEGKAVAQLHQGMPEVMVAAAYPNSVEETIDGSVYKVFVGENAKIYMEGGVVKFFIPTTVVDAGALDKAYDAFAKAYELDPKSVKKVADGMNIVRLASRDRAGALYELRDYNGAAVNFRRQFKTSEHPAVSVVDTVATFYAGLAATLGGDYQNALTDLDKSLALGYEDKGEAYRLKFLDLYQLGQREQSLPVLMEGIKKYPANENLIDMATRYYAENDGDPTALIPLVQEAIDKNPENPNLVQGLARIYDKLGQTDNAILAIRKAVALSPKDMIANLLEGLFIIKKGDAMNADLGKQTFTSAVKFNEANAGVTEVFRSAVAPLERAHELDPTNITAVELLKNLTFRLREDAGMADKNKKYQELFDKLNK